MFWWCVHIQGMHRKAEIGSSSPSFKLTVIYNTSLNGQKSKISKIVFEIAAATAKSLQSCPTLWDPIDGSPPGSPVPGILQARTLEWVAISFSNAWKWKGKVKSLSRVQLLAIPGTAAYQALQSMGFSRQQYWSGLPPLKRWKRPVLPQGILQAEEPSGLQSMGSQRVGHDWSDLAHARAPREQ